MGEHNTLADAISRLVFSPKAHLLKKTDKKKWMILTKHWCAVAADSHKNSSKKHTMDLNQVFANLSDKEDIYPLTVREIAEEQIKDKDLQQQKLTTKLEETPIENTYVLCKEGKMIIPKLLQHRAVAWYHHYLQHPGHTRLEETLRSAMYWKKSKKICPILCQNL